MFSVVIPTHDRLDLLKDAVATVLRQDYDDWELVVFDNASSDDVRGFVKGLGDKRVRYERSDEFLPVTDSWNRAIDYATGSHVSFLGDDDGLAPGYFTGLAKLLREFDSPDVIYSSFYQFLHPGVAPWERRGYVADLRNAFFFVGREVPFRLSAGETAEAVSGSINLRRNFTFNIQAFVFRREFLASIREGGVVFCSPFPDYYLANVALAKARSVVVVPAPMSIAGVSRASFGFTLLNNLEEQGAALLNGKLASDPVYPEIQDRILPGPAYNTNYVVTMEHVVRVLKKFVTHGVNYARYRRLQTYSVLIGTESRLWRTPIGKRLWVQLSHLEKLWAVGLWLSFAVSRRLGRRVYERVLAFFQYQIGPYEFAPEDRICDKGSYSRLIEVFDALEAGKLGRAVT